MRMDQSRREIASRIPVARLSSIFLISSLFIMFSVAVPAESTYPNPQPVDLNASNPVTNAGMPDSVESSIKSVQAISKSQTSESSTISSGPIQRSKASKDLCGTPAFCDDGLPNSIGSSESESATRAKCIDCPSFEAGLKMGSGANRNQSSLELSTANHGLGVAAQQSIDHLKIRTLRKQAISLDIYLYSQYGKRVFQAPAQSESPYWDLTDDRGRPVSNGVYFSVRTYYGDYGQVTHREIRKLVVLR